MTEHALRPGHVTAAAVLIGGVLVMLLPQHALTILRLVIVTAAAAACLWALVAHAPPIWWQSPFDRSGRAREAAAADTDADWIRKTFAGRRQRIAGGPPLPPATLRLLQPLIRSAAVRDGRTGGRLSPLTRALLEAEPLKHAPRWSTLAPDERETTDVVHRVLDELETGEP